MENTFTLQQKIKLIKKLKDIGCNSEKELYEMELERILEIPSITVQEITLFLKLRKYTKSNKLFSYLVDNEKIDLDNQNKKAFK